MKTSRMFLFVVATLLFVPACATPCQELEFIALVECSDKALTAIDSIYPFKKLYWVQHVSFERSNIMRINGTEVSLWFPNLRSVDYVTT